MTDKKKVRAEFETAMRDKFAVKYFSLDDRGRYELNALNYAFDGWQAALSHASATAEECSVVGDVPLLVRTAPERIFLQVADDDVYMDESFPEDESEVTWCAQPILLCEVEYVRADLCPIHQAIAAKRGEK